MTLCNISLLLAYPCWHQYSRTTYANGLTEISKVGTIRPIKNPKLPLRVFFVRHEYLITSCLQSLYTAHFYIVNNSLEQSGNFTSVVYVDSFSSWNLWQTWHCHDVTSLSNDETSTSVNLQVSYSDIEASRSA